MTNDIQHYKRVVAATGQARWDGVISFNAFSDPDLYEELKEIEREENKEYTKVLKEYVKTI